MGKWRLQALLLINTGYKEEIQSQVERGSSPTACFIVGQSNLGQQRLLWIYLSVKMCNVILQTVINLVQFSRIQLFVTPWTAAQQASLSTTNSRSLLKLMSIKSVMPSNHLILCCSFLLLPSIFPSIRVFSDKSVLCIRWPKYQSFSFSISPSHEYSGLISLGWTGLISLQSKGLSSVFTNTKVQMHQFFDVQLYLWSISQIHT